MFNSTHNFTLFYIKLNNILPFLTIFSIKMFIKKSAKKLTFFIKDYIAVVCSLVITVSEVVDSSPTTSNSNSVLLDLCP